MVDGGHEWRLHLNFLTIKSLKDLLRLLFWGYATADNYLSVIQATVTIFYRNGL